jgi:intracellular sulfur oxidation DsrE/DsrF family protein
MSRPTANPAIAGGERRTASRRMLAKAAMALVAGAASAGATAGTARAAVATTDDKPFANHHLVLQISDGEAQKQALVLSVANNMLATYGPDSIAIEIVAFAEGIALLRAESPNRTGVDSLVAQGVLFDACMNTVQTIERETGKKVRLNPHARPVPAGVATILTLVEHGYTLGRP